MFIIRNISGSSVSIDDMGLTLAIGEDYNLSLNESQNDVYASDDLRSQINAGNVVALDPLDGSTQLSSVESIAMVNNTASPNYRIFGGEINQLDDVNVTTPANGQVLTYNNVTGHWENSSVGSSSDELLKVTSNDTTAGYLLSKLLGNAQNITITENNDGGNETATVSVADNASIGGTEGLTVPDGTTAQRPTTPEVGEIRFNTTRQIFEGWNGTAWITFGSTEGNSVTELFYGQLPQITGTTITPYDNTPPLITEGTEFFSRQVTTINANAKVVIWFSSMVSLSNGSRIATVAIYRGSTLIGTTAIGVPSSNAPVIATFIVVDNPPVAGTYTYSGRIGISSSASWYMGYTSNANYGGAANTNNQYVIMRVE